MKGPGPEGPNHISEQPGANGITLLRKMMLIRELEQRTLDLSQTTPPQVVGSAHLCAGQEAVPVGTLAGLNESDQNCCNLQEVMGGLYLRGVASPGSVR